MVSISASFVLHSAFFCELHVASLFQVFNMPSWRIMTPVPVHRLLKQWCRDLSPRCSGGLRRKKLQCQASKSDEFVFPLIPKSGMLTLSWYPKSKLIHPRSHSLCGRWRSGVRRSQAGWSCKRERERPPASRPQGWLQRSKLVIFSYLCRRGSIAKTMSSFWCEQHVNGMGPWFDWFAPHQDWL